MNDLQRTELTRAIAESDIAGCQLENTDIDALVDLFESWLERSGLEAAAEARGRAEGLKDAEELASRRYNENNFHGSDWTIGDVAAQIHDLFLSPSSSSVVEQERERIKTVVLEVIYEAAMRHGAECVTSVRAYQFGLDLQRDVLAAIQKEGE